MAIDALFAGRTSDALGGRRPIHGVTIVFTLATFACGSVISALLLFALCFIMQPIQRSRGTHAGDGPALGSPETNNGAHPFRVRAVVRR